MIAAAGVVLGLAQDFTTYIEPALVANQRWARRISSVVDIDGDGRPDAIVVQAVGAVNPNLSVQFVAVPTTQVIGGTKVALETIMPYFAGYPGFVVEPGLTQAGWSMGALAPYSEQRISRLDDTRLSKPYHVGSDSGYLGVTLSRSGNTHAAWIRLERSSSGVWNAVGSAWNPTAGADLKLGQVPSGRIPAPRYDRSEFTPLPEVSENVYEDLFLGKHWQTNPVTGTKVFEVRLHGPSKFLWRVSTNQPGEAAIIPARQLIDANPPQGVTELNVADGPLLYREETDALGTAVVTGPLKSVEDAYFTYHVPRLGGVSIAPSIDIQDHRGWVRVRRGSWTADHGKDATVVGGPSQMRFEYYDPRTSGQVYMLDLDKDGLIDVVTDFFTEDTWPAGARTSDPRDLRLGWISSFVRPVGDVSLLENPENKTSLFPFDTHAVAGPSGTWTRTEALLWRMQRLSNVLEAGAKPGWIGVRLPSQPTPTYGWITVNAQTVEPFGFPPPPTIGPAFIDWLPGAPVTLGVPHPGPLLFQRESAKSAVITRADSAVGILERRTLEPNAAWIPVPGNPQGPYRISTDESGVLFRLR